MKHYRFCVLAAIALITCLCLAAPEPAIVPGPSDWTLETTFEHPEQFLFRAGPSAKPERFWYMILTLTNKADRDVDFYLKCELLTDTFQVLPAVKGASAALFDKIKQIHQTKYPYLVLLENSGNKILQGDDNTKDILIIWPDFDPNAKTAMVFISGLSNETVAVDHPTQKDASGNPVKVYLRKTLELTYSIGGDPAFRSDQKLKYVSKRWVMR
jgi:hypothetical protein